MFYKTWCKHKRKLGLELASESEPLDMLRLLRIGGGGGGLATIQLGCSKRKQQYFHHINPYALDTTRRLITATD